MAELTINLTVTANPASPRIALTISKDVSSSELRRLVSEKTLIPLDKLRLITRGKLISNNDSNEAVAEYKLEEGVVLHCMGKPEGGAAPAAAAAPVPAAAATTAGSSVTVQPPPAAASTTTPTADSSSNPLQAAFAAMKAGNPPAAYKTAVTTLEKILSNIINKPMEEKYRKVKKQNAAFQKKLGGLQGGDDTMKACGFVVDVEEGEEVYIMHASAEKWPQLVAAKTAVEAAVREANASANQASAPPLMPGAGMPNFGAMPGMAAGGMNPGMMGPDMQAAAARMMQDPAMLQNMLQNPMVQNMIRNDPRFANNPMARQSMEQLMNNPQMIQQIAQMMRDPNMQQQMQQMQQMMGAAGGGMAGMPPGGFGGMPPFGGMAPAAGNAGAAQQQQQGSSNAGASGGSDQDQTEEEMIAEAIRRSLEEGGS